MRITRIPSEFLFVSTTLLAAIVIVIYVSSHDQNWEKLLDVFLNVLLAAAATATRTTDAVTIAVENDESVIDECLRF